MADTTTSETIRDLIFDEVTDLANRFIDYDRREDKELPPGAIEQAIQDGSTSIAEIAAYFRTELSRALKHD